MKKLKDLSEEGWYYLQGLRASDAGVRDEVERVLAGRPHKKWGAASAYEEVAGVVRASDARIKKLVDESDAPVVLMQDNTSPYKTHLRVVSPRNPLRLSPSDRLAEELKGRVNATVGYRYEPQKDGSAFVGHDVTFHELGVKVELPGTARMCLPRLASEVEKTAENIGVQGKLVILAS